MVLLLILIAFDPSPNMDTNTEEMSQACLSIVPQFVASTLELIPPFLHHTSLPAVLCQVQEEKKS